MMFERILKITLNVCKISPASQDDLYKIYILWILIIASVYQWKPFKSHCKERMLSEELTILKVLDLQSQT